MSDRLSRVIGALWDNDWREKFTDLVKYTQEGFICKLNPTPQLVGLLSTADCFNSSQRPVEYFQINKSIPNTLPPLRSYLYTDGRRSMRGVWPYNTGPYNTRPHNTGPQNITLVGVVFGDSNSHFFQFLLVFVFREWPLRPLYVFQTNPAAPLSCCLPPVHFIKSTLHVKPSKQDSFCFLFSFFLV